MKGILFYFDRNINPTRISPIFFPGLLFRLIAVLDLIKEFIQVKRFLLTQWLLLRSRVLVFILLLLGVSVLLLTVLVALGVGRSVGVLVIVGGEEVLSHFLLRNIEREILISKKVKKW